MTEKTLTYKELMDLALENYNKGGDGTYECWDETIYNSYLKMVNGKFTKADALKMFAMDYNHEQDVMGY